MTGFPSKKAAALDEEGMYLVHQTAQPAPVQEPKWKPTEGDYKEWWDRHGLHEPTSREAFYDAASLYLNATPPAAQRPWVGLTDEQTADYLGDEYHAMTESDLRFFRLGESAAKEKNNG